MLRLLSRMFPLALCGAVSLLASSALAIPINYQMTGSLMAINSPQGGCTPATCNSAVNGFVTIDDDGVGNVSITGMSLAHLPYQVGNPALISVFLDRDAISLGAGPVSAPGSTISSVVAFPATQFAQVGTSTCIPVLFPCALAGLPTGVSPLASPIPINLGNFTFDAFGNFTASITYTVNPNATETLTLVGTVPEPGTMALVAAGLVGLAIRRRSAF